MWALAIVTWLGNGTTTSTMLITGFSTSDGANAAANAFGSNNNGAGGKPHCTVTVIQVF